jgi:hypothetical protein
VGKGKAHFRILAREKGPNNDGDGDCEIFTNNANINLGFFSAIVKYKVGGLGDVLRIMDNLQLPA